MFSGFHRRPQGRGDGAAPREKLFKKGSFPVPRTRTRTRAAVAATAIAGDHDAAAAAAEEADDAERPPPILLLVPRGAWTPTRRRRCRGGR